jgi:hypothetical protein
LPKGATLILVAPLSEKNDYQLWGRMSHINVEWVELQDRKSLFDMNTVLKIVKYAVKRYHRYNDCYDSYSDPTPSHMQNALDRLTKA